MRSQGEHNEEWGQHLAPPKSPRACHSPATGTRTGGGIAAKGQRGLTGQGARDMIPKARAEHHVAGDYCKISRKVREKCPSTLKPAAPCSLVSPSGGEKSAGGDKTRGKAGEGASSCPGSLLAPSQGTARVRLIPASQAVAQLRLRW